MGGSLFRNGFLSLCYAVFHVYEMLDCHSFPYHLVVVFSAGICVAYFLFHFVLSWVCNLFDKALICVFAMRGFGNLLAIEKVYLYS